MPQRTSTRCTAMLPKSSSRTITLQRWQRRACRCAVCVADYYVLIKRSSFCFQLSKVHHLGAGSSILPGRSGPFELQYARTSAAFVPFTGMSGRPWMQVACQTAETVYRCQKSYSLRTSGGAAACQRDQTATSPRTSPSFHPSSRKRFASWQARLQPQFQSHS